MMMERERQRKEDNNIERDLTPTSVPQNQH